MTRERPRKGEEARLAEEAREESGMAVTEGSGAPWALQLALR